MPISNLKNAIKATTGQETIHEAAVGYDPALAVMPVQAEAPARFLLDEDGAVIGLNLANTGLTDNQWANIMATLQPEKLQALNLRGNKLTKSPVTPEMRALRHLDLNNNKIESFEPPQPLALEHIWLYGNDMSNPPLEIVAQGQRALLNYFKERSRQPSRALREAKLLLLGEGGAGKTTLARKIQDIEAPLPGKDESTRGIDIATFQFDTDKGPFKARIWDFGGQQIYHGTHRFFLTKRSLWVIVADNRKQNTDFNYWLQMAELYGDESPLYIVVNQSDDRPPYWNTEGMRDRFDFLKDLLAANFDTLAETHAYKPEMAEKNTRDTLKITERLKHEVANLSHVDMEWPASWTEIRSDLECLTGDYISVSDFYKICEKRGISAREPQLMLSAFLHDLGIILHFQDDAVLKDTIILKMDWATQAVFAAYDSFVVNSGGSPGFFHKNDIARIWGDPRFRDKHKQLLALMLRFKLCYQVRNTEVYIMPELLPAEQPDLAAIIPVLKKETLAEAQAIRYSYAFMPKGIFARFAVDTHRLIAWNQQLIWKEGAVLQIEDSYAVVSETYGDREIVIRAIGSHRKELMSIITHYFDEIHDTFLRLQVKKLVPCNCDTCKALPVPHYYEYKNLVDRLARQKATVECANSYEDVPVKDLLEKLFAPEQKAERMYDVRSYAEPEDDNGKIKVFVSYSESDKAYLQALKKHLAPLERNNTIEIWYDELLLPGSVWDYEIKKQLNRADIILFLASPDFLATDYIWEEEIPVALERSQHGSAVAIPVILRPCDWVHTSLKDLSALPLKGTPVSSFENADMGYVEVVNGLHKLIKSKFQ